jgi:hypothetical protein
VVRGHPGCGERETVNAASPHPTSGRLELTVSGPVASSVLRLLDDRYDRVSTERRSGADTVVTIADIDQAGERAVLNLLWDTGHQIRAMRRREA